MQTRTRLDLMDDLNWRLANETRAGANKFWIDGDLHTAITAALLRAEPLGDPQIIEMTSTGYSAATQQPQKDVVAIRDIQVVQYSRDVNDPPVTRLGQHMWRLYRNSPQWLWLNNPIFHGDILRIHAIVAYVLDETPSTVITADNEMILNYAMAYCYQRFIQNGQVDGQDEAILMQQYEQKGDLRRQTMIFMQYPEQTADERKKK